MSLYVSDDSWRDDFYEWLLSDAPTARAERQRRRDDALQLEREQRERVATWSYATQINPRASANLLELAGIMDSITARQEAREAEREALSDAERIRRAREQMENHRRGRGDFDYPYPAAYLGSEAARQPIPDEATRPADLQPGMRVREFIGERAFAVADVEGGPDRTVVIDTDGRRHDYDTPVHLGIVRDDRYAGPTVDLEASTRAVGAVDEPEPDWLDIEHQGLCRGCLSDPCHCSSIDGTDLLGNAPGLDDEFGIDL